MPTDRKAYFESYYQERRDAFLKRRRDRYKGDPKYRELAKERSRARRERLKIEREKLRAAGKLPKKERKKKTMVVDLGGKRVVAHPFKILSEKVNRSLGTLNYWERAGLLPRTPLIAGNGDRFYTEGMILVVQMAVSKRGRIKKNDFSFYDEIAAGWVGLGIFVAEKKRR